MWNYTYSLYKCPKGSLRILIDVSQPSGSEFLKFKAGRERVKNRSKHTLKQQTCPCMFQNTMFGHQQIQLQERRSQHISHIVQVRSSLLLEKLHFIVFKCAAGNVSIILPSLRNECLFICFDSYPAKGLWDGYKITTKQGQKTTVINIKTNNRKQHSHHTTDLQKHPVEMALKN